VYDSRKPAIDQNVYLIAITVIRSTLDNGSLLLLAAINPFYSVSGLDRVYVIISSHVHCSPEAITIQTGGKIDASSSGRRYHFPSAMHQFLDQSRPVLLRAHAAIYGTL
jgi:hypothetical protein